jgi:hypothetical protein
VLRVEQVSHSLGTGSAPVLHEGDLTMADAQLVAPAGRSG